MAAADGLDRVALRCTAAGRDFALPLDDVLEVHRAVAVSPLPAAPDGIVGVVDVRGELTPVLDLGIRLGRPHGEIRPGDAFVRVAVRRRTLLLLVSSASAIERIRADRVTAGETLVPGARFLGEIAGTERGPLLIHDLAEFLSVADLSSLDRALAERSSAVAVPT